MGEPQAQGRGVASRTARVAVAASTAAGAFVVYAKSRAMAETVGFTWSGTWAGVGACLCLSVPVLAVVYLTASIRSRGRRTLPAWVTAAFAAGLAAGCVVSELWILTDESAFAAEVARDPATEHARMRGWPCRPVWLMYTPGRGTRAVALWWG